ncbi:heme NO-binding domain-containing protein [Vibrio ostreicida]|uniref:Heme NO-binding domain-containing protein n=1 Tax=Vibrio ostreicida TaxID=526588 RepID=A0ABT8BU82_9VIBR|nr:heme NO-binding domain-containing protein [Vibrio ostreicida]MDN3609944.1 heme NO-binding domain-containing protein [Vibrio ostreicida]NPD10372.1 heme NO-binding domain-containing protein [Vibrio ostreicida]
MQGAVFTAFSDMIIEKMGMDTLDELIDKTEPESGGIYTAGGNYADSELLNMVVALSEKSNIPAEDLVRAFGQYLFKQLYDSCPTDVSQISDLKTFLLAIDGVIHKEVKRVYPQAYLPSFSYQELGDGSLEIFYNSDRELCELAEGLIVGASEYFSQPITLSHPDCLHRGDQHCKIVVEFKES